MPEDDLSSIEMLEALRAGKTLEYRRRVVPDGLWRTYDPKNPGAWAIFTDPTLQFRRCAAMHCSMALLMARTSNRSVARMSWVKNNHITRYVWYHESFGGYRMTETKSPEALPKTTAYLFLQSDLEAKDWYTLADLENYLNSPTK